MNSLATVIQILRKRVGLVLFGGLMLLLVSGCDSSTTAYPTRTVTIICPWAQGGGTDRNSRFWAEQWEKELGTRFVVRNRTGGSGAVGHGHGANAEPDGYTVTMITAELSTMHLMGVSELTHDDFELLLQVNADPAALLVHRDAPWQDLGQLLDAIRQQPKTLKMSGTATGGTWDLSRAGLMHAADIPIDAVTWVPTEGAAPSINKLLGGHIDVVCCSLPEAEAQLQLGELRALAVMADERLAGYPDVPTCRESGVDWSSVGWRGLAVPRETPAEVVDTLVAAAERITASDAFTEFMQKNNFGIQVRLRDEFREFLVEQDAIWKPVVEAAGYAP